MPDAHLKIALLGWGSLLWDKRPEFDDYHGPWLPDGPMLPLEFSRVSTSRQGALTLVIDDANGTPCRTAYALSTRRNPDDALADLRCREGTVMKHMGFWYADESRRCTRHVPETIREWAEEKGLDVVIWTGLPSNFGNATDDDFSVANAIRHLQSLPPEGKAMAAEYVWRAPNLVNTPLRRALQAEPWFAPVAPSTES